MRLIYDGESPVDHPATGLTLFPGEHDYPEEKAEQLIAAGLRVPGKTKSAKVKE